MTGALEFRAWWLGAALAVATAAGCSIDTEALGGGGDGGRVDAGDAGVRPDGDLDGFVPPVDAGPLCEELGGPRVVRVLDADDFGDTGAERDGVEVERPGQLALELSPYRYGGLLVEGYTGALLGTDPDFADVAGETPTGLAILERIEQGWSGTESMPGLLLEGADEYTALASGEIFLGSGSHSLRLEVDDNAIVEIGGIAGGGTAIAGLGSPGTSSFTVADAGWYPIRLAWDDTGEGSSILLELTLPDDSTEIVGAARLRTDLSDVPGRELFGWDSRDPDDTPDGERIDQDDTAEDFTTVAFPQGVGIADSSDFTARWVGRHPLDLGGSLVASGDDHYELWLDGVFLGQASDGTYSQLVPRGTYDVILELDQGGGGRDISLLYDGAPFQPEQLRPRTRFGGVPFAAGSNVETNVDGGNTHSVTLDVVAPDVPLAAIEVSVVATSPEPGTVDVVITAPSSESFTFALDSHTRSGLLNNRRVFRVVIDPDDVVDASGGWTVMLDNGGTMRTVWDRAGVLVHARGETEPYATTGTFTSAVLELEAETVLTRLQSVVDAPADTSVGLEVRAARVEAELATAPWTAVEADSDLSGSLRGSFAQVRVTLEGPGHDTPRVMDLRLVGEPCLACEGCPLALEGLVARYTFEEGEGRRVRDLSGFEYPQDLFVGDLDQVTWTAEGLTIDGATIVSSVFPAQKLVDACAAGSELTVEAWIRPANTSQGGPARIVTLSVDNNTRNFTFGQDGADYILRLRSTETDGNGLPVIEVSGVDTTWQHVVWAKDSSDMLRMWIDGVHQVTMERAGDFSGWDPMVLALANEVEAARPWLGGFRQVAVYCRALTPTEVNAHFDAGMDP